MILLIKTPSPKPPRVLRLGCRATHIRMALKLSTLANARAAFWFVAFQCVAVAASESPPRHGGAWRAVIAVARDLTCLEGAGADRVALFACSPDCTVIPWQLDERDHGGAYVLNFGPGATADIDGGAIDENDEVVFMWSDTGSTQVADLPWPVLCSHEISVETAGRTGWVYAALFPGVAPRSPRRYVDYDVDDDVMRGRSVALTFAGPTPRGLELLSGAAAGLNLLDRLKIRASARFFGIFPLSRDEDDIVSVYDAWSIGPVRVLRRERKWINLAFGYRTPYLHTETAFYRDYVQLPVRFHLNFSPAQLLSGIVVRASLDFRNLRGWRFAAPGALSEPFTVGNKPAEAAAALAAGLPATMLAVEGADTTLALVLQLGPTLRSLNQTIFYREDLAPDGPEDVLGQMPGIGFLLTEWGHIERGEHWFVAESYALPPGYDPAVFADELATKLVVRIGPTR